MTSENGSGAGILGFLGITVAVILFIYIMDWGFLTGRITEYPLLCPSDYTEGNGCFTLNTTDYYPDARTQTVKMKTEFGIKTLTKCSVINRSNWECKFDDESATFGFTDGKFHSFTLESGFFSPEEALESDLQYQYVGRFRYLLEDWGIL